MNEQIPFLYMLVIQYNNIVTHVDRAEKRDSEENKYSVETAAKYLCNFLFNLRVKQSSSFSDQT
jgi:hypothetical protein